MRIARRESSGVVEAVAETREVDSRRYESIDQSLVNLLVGVVAGLPQRIIRLIGDQDQQISRLLQPEQCGNHPVDQTKVPSRKRRFHVACAWVQDHRVQDAVAVEEDGRAVHCADSHFISLARRRGWETMRCQTTA